MRAVCVQARSHWGLYNNDDGSDTGAQSFGANVWGVLIGAVVCARVLQLLPYLPDVPSHAHCPCLRHVLLTPVATVVVVDAILVVRCALLVQLLLCCTSHALLLPLYAAALLPACRLRPPPPVHTFVDVRYIAYNKNPDNSTLSL